MSEEDERMQRLNNFFCEGMEDLPSAMAGGGAKGRSLSETRSKSEEYCLSSPAHRMGLGLGGELRGSTIDSVQVSTQSSSTLEVPMVWTNPLGEPNSDFTLRMKTGMATSGLSEGVLAREFGKGSQMRMWLTTKHDPPVELQVKILARLTKATEDRKSQPAPEDLLLRKFHCQYNTIARELDLPEVEGPKLGTDGWYLDVSKSFPSGNQTHTTRVCTLTVVDNLSKYRDVHFGVEIAVDKAEEFIRGVLFRPSW